MYVCDWNDKPHRFCGGPNKEAVEGEPEPGETLEATVDEMLHAYDQSGLTDLGWFAPYVEAVRDAYDRERIERYAR